MRNYLSELTFITIFFEEYKLLNSKNNYVNFLLYFKIKIVDFDLNECFLLNQQFKIYVNLNKINNL